MEIPPLPQQSLPDTAQEDLSKYMVESETESDNEDHEIKSNVEDELPDLQTIDEVSNEGSSGDDSADHSVFNNYDETESVMSVDAFNNADIPDMNHIHSLISEEISNFSIPVLEQDESKSDDESDTIETLEQPPTESVDVVDEESVDVVDNENTKTHQQEKSKPKKSKKTKRVTV